jgi:activator of HSP90 ATPase
MTYDFTLECDLPAPPSAVYEAWLDSGAHSAMTGGEARIEKRVGGAYTAWDGYISGKTLELTPGERIVQSWRTTRFTPADADSTITIHLFKAGTRLTLSHKGVPDGHTSYEKGGWRDFYFKPMKAYFKTPQVGAEARKKDAMREGAAKSADGRRERRRR